MAQPPAETLLIGRRVLRSSNSFMHNLPSLVKGPNRCTLQISLQDAAQIGLMDSGSARITNRVGSVIALSKSLKIISRCGQPPARLGA